MAQQLIALQEIVRYPGQIIWTEHVLRMLEPTAQQGIHQGRTTRTVRISGMAQDAQEAVLSDQLAGPAVMGMVDKPLMSGS